MLYHNDKLEKELLEEINANASIHSYKEGDVIMDYGKYVKFMPLILKGSIKVMRRDEEGREILLYYLSGNDTCSLAYSFSLDPQQSEIKAVAEEDVELIALSHQKLDEWLCKYPSWKRFILESFNNRFLELLRTVETIAFKKLDERLVQYLLEKKRLSGSAVIKASHNTIAEELATSRVVISRLLKQLENDKKVILYRNELKIIGQL